MQRMLGLGLSKIAGIAVMFAQESCAQACARFTQHSEFPEFFSEISTSLLSPLVQECNHLRLRRGLDNKIWRCNGRYTEFSSLDHSRERTLDRYRQTCPKPSSLSSSSASLKIPSTVKYPARYTLGKHNHPSPHSSTLHNLR